ncbi:MAG: TPM domain-containing protein [Clostridia bacterium]|nr:TPM domain-containing protein [Clostridia bacterium]
MKKLRVLFLFALVFVLSLSISAASPYVLDRADVFYDEDIAELDEIAAAVEARSGLRCVFLADTYSDDFDPALAVLAGDAEDLSLFALLDSEDTLYYNLYQYSATEGESALLFTEDENDDICKQTLALIREGDCLGAAKKFFELSEVYFTNGEDAVVGTDDAADEIDDEPIPEGYVLDYASLLSKSEIKSLSELAAKVEADTGLRCVFLTGYSLGSVNERLSVYADGAQDLSLVAVDMYERRFDHYQYNATDGYLAFRLNNRETDDILDTMQPLMHGGEYFAAAKTFVSLSAEYFANSDNFSLGKDGFGENGYTGVNTPSVFDYGVRAYLIFILKGALIGLAVGAIVALLLFAAYKHKVHGNTYPLDEFTKM